MQATRAIQESKAGPLNVEAGGQMGVNALYASLFERGVSRLELKRFPGQHTERGADYLNVLQVLDIPQALQLAAEGAELDLQ